MVRSDQNTIPSTVILEPPAQPEPPGRKAPSNPRPAKRPKKSTESAQTSSRSAAKAPKKKTKNQLNEKAMQRRRELAAFDKNKWDTDTDVNAVEPPSTTSTPLHAASGAASEGIPFDEMLIFCILSRPNHQQHKHGVATNSNAGTDATAATVADANATTVAANADMEAGPGLHEESAGDLSDASEADVTADSQDEAYDPDQDDDDDVGNSTSTARDGETKDADAHVVCDDTTRFVLRDQSGTSPLRFDYTDVLDPNLVEPSGDNGLDPNGECDEDSAEASSDVSDVDK
ncbi:hypothetical protein PHYSODRAFT_293002 [Phytophthora sojae]|uniref:Uncharacterized protein n=1 Tax=Phytophthora sojae (strain P6497) TaxID=1094619 RepID=G4YE94_PHYSP|nr:hypothetical protein PHYSODRAFT_293002 [Phytophthora sojae]EGZ26801.1 hypothetical protein PHYSODRAFT_293002 [Phytophthora sojae]|eukprot:XP_009514076.1 hypothetical protein PHYSODRAFT_293002 [Phytophthora sojae]